MPRDTNTKLGIKSLPDNNKKYDANNVSIGYKSLNSNKKGFQNTSVGSESMRSNTESHNNTAVGFKSLEKSVGKYNTALGAITGKTLSDGKSNVIIGKEADVSKKDAKNQVIIGANAKGLEDNSVTLGNNEVNNVFMSDTKNASLHCGVLNIYNNKGRKSYSFPDIGANKNNILETDGKGNLRWVNRVMNLDGLSDGKTIYDKTLTYISEFKGISPKWEEEEDSTPKTVSIGNLFLGKDTGKNIVPQVIAKFNDNNNPNTQTGETLSGTRNTGIGFEVLQNSLNADKATALGYQALKNNNGDNNTAIGAFSLYSNTTGSNNTAMGDESLFSNTTGIFNTAIGQNSLKYNTTGSDNTALGDNCLAKNTEGNNNTAVGSVALIKNTTGNNNTTIGFNSLKKNITGSDNTAVGFKAGEKITTGSNNVIIGQSADSSSATATNQIVIGQGASGQGDNSVTLGNSDVTDIYMAQDKGATIHAGGFNMYNSGSTVYTLPTTDGTANQVLLTNGSGTTSFADVPEPIKIFKTFTRTITKVDLAYFHPNNPLSSDYKKKNAGWKLGTLDVTVPTGFTATKICVKTDNQFLNVQKALNTSFKINLLLTSNTAVTSATGLNTTLTDEVKILGKDVSGSSPALDLGPLTTDPFQSSGVSANINQVSLFLILDEDTSLNFDNIPEDYSANLVISYVLV